MEPSLEDDYEDAPCFEITIKVTVTGSDVDEAFDYLKETLDNAKRQGNKEVFSVDYEDHKEC